ncbi:MAG: preprotein translocase subunit YajC [Sandaracinaceae bacterium]|nr:preprotein translocase subunit YajC [Sandaracinaceae bacterium]
MQGGLMAVMLVVFYFFLIRPEQKRRKETEEMLASIRKGTKVRTAGGILGEVISMNEGEVVLQIAKNVRINILRANISTVESARLAEAEKTADKSSDKSSDKEPEAGSDESSAEAKDKA